MELITRRTIKEMTGNAANVNLSAYSNPDSPEYQEMVKRIGVQLNFTSLRFHRLDAVSYTHLDVYKRQVLSLATPN